MGIDTEHTHIERIKYSQLKLNMLKRSEAALPFLMSSVCVDVYMWMKT